jgi:hypothetical protein
MEHLNYCRQIRKQMQDQLRIPSLQGSTRQLLAYALDLCAASQKFILPNSGFLLADIELRALSGDIPLRLPHPVIALEFQHQAQKMVVFAVERLDEKEIGISVAFGSPVDGTWALALMAQVPMTGYFGTGLPGQTGLDGLRFFSQFSDAEHRGLSQCANESVSCLLSFLNALACSNVAIERSAPKRGNKKVKAALPFDTYHILTIDVPASSGTGAATGGHRSPREHLRRGHIRRLADGRRIWVNATVVAASRGAGVVTKDYALRAAA